MAHWSATTAFRYARARSGDGIVSSMTSVSLSGLVLGVAVLVIVLSVMNGFERELRERVLGVLAHGVLTAQQPVNDWRLLAEQISNHPEINGVAPIEEASGLVVANGHVAGVQIAGIDPTQESRVSMIPQHLIEGNLNALEAGMFNVVLGRDLANKLSATTGDTVTFVMPQTRMTLAGPQPRMRRFQIVGVFQVGSDADKNQVYMHIEDALKLNRRTSVVSFRIAVSDLFEAPRIMQEVARAIPNQDWYGNSWMRRHGNLYDAIQTQKTTLFLLLLMLVAVAAFNIVSNLILIVNDRRSDIAILRTMGASTSDIGKIFVLQGLIIGAGGVLVGLGLGSLIAYYMTDVYQYVDQFFQLGLMNEYFIDYLPSQILGSDLMMIASVSLLICFFATVYPARVASRTRPAEALRYE